MPQCRAPSYARFANFRCGWCKACEKHYANTWVARMLLESHRYDPNEITFLTLTYNDDHLPPTVKLAKRDWQLFMKRFRKQYGKELRYVASLERGDLNDRLHWHAIIYGMPYMQEYSEWLAKKVWKNGFIKWLPVSVRRMRYVIKYVLKSRRLRRMAKLLPHLNSLPVGHYPGVFLMSRKPAIGSYAIPDIQNALTGLSRTSVVKLRGHLSPDLNPLEPKPLPALSIGGTAFPLHRFLKDRLKIRSTIRRLNGVLLNEEKEKK